MKYFLKPQIILIIIALLSFLGFLDSTFLTIKHYQGVLPPCSLALGCEKVLNSQYATIINIPIALLGSVFYLAVMGLSIVLIQKDVRSEKWEHRKIHILTSNLPLQRILILLILSGFIVSVILFLIQAFDLHSFCQYCLFSEAITVLLLILSVVLMRLKLTI